MPFLGDSWFNPAQVHFFFVLFSSIYLQYMEIYGVWGKSEVNKLKTELNWRDLLFYNIPDISFLDKFYLNGAK